MRKCSKCEESVLKTEKVQKVWQKMMKYEKVCKKLRK